jgi:hypothetical protein
MNVSDISTSDEQVKDVALLKSSDTSVHAEYKNYIELPAAVSVASVENYQLNTLRHCVERVFASRRC